jgi:hypothetical protein
MGAVRFFRVGVAFTTVLTVVTACGGSQNTSSSSSSSTASSTSASSTSSATASTTSSAPPSDFAPLADYSNLLIQPSDVGANAATVAPPLQNPQGVAGVSVTFTNPAHTRTLDDLLLIFVDPGVAAQKAKDRASYYNKYVTTAPQPLDVGTNGLMAVGLSPDNSKAVTYLTFAEGKAIVDLEFDSAPNDPAPQDAVLDIARKQDAVIKSKLPS